ncbi:CDP-alcohol phosphatidyltransferase family protein [Iodobacter fluviatilis]|uniref:Inner membrane protein ynbA n=1 Tax=Iodobacter fluviatilis TaxID=537 RepID=A0A377Q988_9NEIS|nr:CDP-alcohol phosphatidyltransferase family protein [Iodobacter fluviatilis]TCU88445.1 phosphatidylglycerophosphate synthase [Iodobacter fluviatilis]STQ91483.1 Inner membrane protein ynbA [Iodobacter fluviatilis]
MPSIYQLKSRFQSLLRPLCTLIARLGISANQVTLFAMMASILMGLWLSLQSDSRLPWLILPLFLLLRMALNAIDGMLAREFNQQSALGGILNEVGDVVSDIALYLPFCLISNQPAWIILAVFLAFLTEFIGVLGPSMGAARRYDGPMGKSDRAFVYGGFALFFGFFPALSSWTSALFAITAGMMLWTCINRAKGILARS